MTEQGEHSALTLAAAAQALGITESAVRMRWKRGKMEGFKRDGRIHVYVGKAPEQRPEQSSEPVKSAREQVTEQTERFTDTETATIVELQRTELTRLLRDNERLHSDAHRLNERIDTLLDTHAKERDREQVLRQQLQNQIERLSAQLALPAPDSEQRERLEAAERDAAKVRQEMGALKGGVVALLRWIEKRR